MALVNGPACGMLGLMLSVAAAAAPARIEVRIEDLFAAQAAATPDAVAVLFRDQALSYGQLGETVDGLAADLASCGVGPGVLVALCAARTPAMIALVLAVLQAGGAYLPVDPRYPAERMAFMLSDSAAAVLITDGVSSAWPGFAGTVLQLLDGRLVQRAYRGPPAGLGSADLAYVIYTSGSTGGPKGVMLGHAATHLVTWAQGAYSAQELSCVAATTSLSFDPSVFEIFVPLCTGGTVLLKQDALEPFGRNEHPTMLDTVPSVLRELCRADAIPRSVRALNVGGEPLSASLVREAYRQRPELTIHNHYGPTEATTCVTVLRVPRDLAGEPSLGVPVRDAEIVLLSLAGEPTSEGQVGEIHIGGPGLALGYLNRPQLTAERFVSGPYGRLYRTGDLGAWRDGELHFAGRLDRQVKVRGFRIEPAEIEAALLRDARIERALVVVREAPTGAQLVAYLESSHALSPAAVRKALAASLPGHMIPAHILVLRAFPQLVSGKIDHAALPDPLSRSAEADDAPSRAERPILHVFEEVLGRASIGPNESFFDLGGDSLASVRAALRLEEVLGHDVPAGLLHQAPTARALAAALEHAKVQQRSHLSLLRRGGQGLPLFCVADLFGQPFNYLSLARELAPDRPVYGLAPGPLQAAFTADGDVERLIEGFKAAVRDIQPRGPYLVAGYSVGGLLAASLAGALEREGESVGLVLLDSLLQRPRPPLSVLARWSLGQGRELLTLHGPTRAERLRTLAGQLLRLSRSPRSPGWIPRGQIAFASRLIRVAGAYRPPAVTAPVLMVSAGERDPVDNLFDQDGLSGWSNILRGEVTRAVVAGGHHQFMRAPNVAATADAVRQFLRRFADG